MKCDGALSPYPEVLGLFPAASSTALHARMLSRRFVIYDRVITKIDIERAMNFFS